MIMIRTLQRVLVIPCFSSFVVLAEATAQADKPVVLKSTHQVRIERAVMIPMRDGKRLSADLIRPDAEGRFPAIIMYHPYRKDDVGRGGIGEHYDFAERGFVAVRLDARGTGSSEGTNTDEYLPQEQEDGYDAVEWLARQPWSNGNVGMYGASYSGFTALQVALHRPPHLKAIVPVYATDDRYTDDCHYTPGGNMRMYYDVGSYGGWMVAMNALPPVPELTGGRWAEMWQDRLEHNEPYLLKWMKHQVDGPYWRNGSLRPGYDRIQCPVFLIAGWRDGYPNPMLRTYTQLKVPKKLWVGPWVHTLPHSSVPGPRVDWMNEATRFFAHWLRAENTGIMDEPSVSIYMKEYAVPVRSMDITPGHWRNDADFPVTGAKEVTFYLDENGKLAEKTSEGSHQGYDEYEYRATVGLSNGYWSGGGIPFYLPDDQRADEAYSLVYTTQPLNQEIHILGWPKLVLHASSSARVATFVAKLADVAPDGHSALIVDGSLNGTRRASFTDPSPLTPGEIYELNVPIWPTGWVLKPGHRLRLSISSSDFPNLWPTPEPARNRLYHGGRYTSRLTLPVVPKSKLPPPEFLPPPRLHQLVSSYGTPPTLQVVSDEITGTAAIVSHSSGTTVLDENLGSILSERDFRCSASSRDPAHASIVGLHKLTVQREDGVIEVSAESTIRATRTDFHIIITLNVYRNGKPFFQRQWTATEPRRLL